MLMKVSTPNFATLNSGYQRLFKVNHLTIGLVLPLESYPDRAVPTLAAQLERVQLAESLGFGAVWLRDIPFNVPSFGDAGQVFDPFVYLGLLAGQTRDITLGVSSILLPLRHPVHVAKSAASVDVLSGGRLVLGVASGDRPAEFPAFKLDYKARGERFREAYKTVRMLAQEQPVQLAGAEQLDVLPKPVAGRVPLMITGSSQQSDAWIASHGDGWMSYPREAALQARIIARYRSENQQAGHRPKPVMEPLYIDLLENADAPPEKIHLGYRLGVNALRDYLRERQAIGVNHIALNLRFNQADPENTLQKIAAAVLPEFPLHQD